ncbi:hypothetical protein BP6252_03587 [Coleophoma cylindrospora]|uniref:Metallo-beta-lactamase domain-containing protein n=1 Tax=Coleophoma cylindrospora TaxID=1849047 RepID=A0A3D8S814_9HELO|nr:hypothetical protein BP6252_03587 [Coleophoma cylindrospora]
MAAPQILTKFHAGTGTWQYIVADASSSQAIIIDSVLDFDPSSRKVSSTNADELLTLVHDHGLQVVAILETHAHADHLTAARYLQQKLSQTQPRPAIGIGKRITQVQRTFAKKYGVDEGELEDVFDRLWDDDEEFAVGDLVARVLYLPGHTPDHVGYMIGSNVFTGDSIFNPDVGSARADFPGGSATDLYKSTQLLLSLPGHYRLYTGHDYPPSERETGSESGEKWKAYSTVEEQNRENKHLKKGTVEADFIKWRAERDAGLGEPKLLHQALQFNIRAGRLPLGTTGGDRLVHLPLRVDDELRDLMDG